MDDRRIGILDQIQCLSRREEGLDRSQLVQHLKEDYNTAVETAYNNNPGIFVDIIEAFPPEIWIPIIQESLPVQHYSSSLLLLTMVSKKWQQAITSIPLLWARIEISGIGEDALAMIHTFAYLSNESPILLTLYMPFNYKPDILGLILYSISKRMHRIEFKIDRHPSSWRNSLSAESLFKEVVGFLRHWRYISNVTHLEIEEHPNGQIMHAGMAHVTDFLTPYLQVIRGLCLCQVVTRFSRAGLQRLEDIGTCVQIETLMRCLGHLPRLKRLTMTHNTLVTPLPTMTVAPLLSNLTGFSFKQKWQSLPIELIDIVTPQLLDLDLHASYTEVPDIVECLAKAVRLHTLSLTMTDWKDGMGMLAMPSVTALKNSIASLRSLSVSFDTDLIRSKIHDLKHLTQLRLIEAIRFLYQNVDDVVFSLVSVADLISPIFEYLSELGSLKRLKLDGLGWDVLSSKPPEFTLQTLKVLELSTPALVGYIRAPQLLDLTLPWDDECEEDGVLSYPSLRTLHIKGGDDSSHRIDVPTDGVPSLTSLRLHVSGCDSLQLGLALFLTELTIIGEPDTSIATSLCFTILYQSEECPSLCSLRLLGCAPEWDVFITTLEIRNFMENRGVSRIRRVTLPNVPYRLRGPIASLLRGLYTPRSQNEEISIKWTMEMFFDRLIPGCRTCLKGMLGPCDEPITYTSDESEIEDLAYSVYSTVYDPPSPSLDPTLLDWIYRRERDIESWVAAVFTSGGTCWRKPICNRQKRSTPVGITEHDIFGTQS